VGWSFYLRCTDTKPTDWDNSTITVTQQNILEKELWRYIWDDIYLFLRIGTCYTGLFLYMSVPCELTLEMAITGVLPNILVLSVISSSKKNVHR
jgi:hypothetical protein